MMDGVHYMMDRVHDEQDLLWPQQSQATVVPKSIKYKIMTLTLFPTSGCQFANPLSFSLYLRHGFCSESKFVKENSIMYENQTVKLY